MRVARSAKSVLEAQFQDVIRRQIGNVCCAFVDLQSAADHRLPYGDGLGPDSGASRRHGPAPPRPGEKDAEVAAERLSIELDKARGEPCTTLVTRWPMPRKPWPCSWA